jgi:hypothetical protein
MTASSIAVAVLAHQGGWDEVLLVLAPLSIFAGLLYLANVRATRQLEARQHEGERPGGDDATAGEDTAPDDG